MGNDIPLNGDNPLYWIFSLYMTGEVLTNPKYLNYTEEDLKKEFEDLFKE